MERRLRTVIQARLLMREELRKRFNFRDVNRGVAKITRQAFDDAVAQCDALSELQSVEGGDFAATAIGDGEFLKRIIAFFQSPKGQAILKFLLGLVTTFLWEA